MVSIKQIKSGIFVLLFSFIAIDHTAQAFVDAQLLVGKRWSKLKSDSQEDSLSANEITAAAHLDPIPLIPISFGMYYSILDYETDASKSMGLSSFSGNIVGLEASAWLPMVPVVTPYVKASFPIFTSLESKAEVTDPTTNQVSTSNAEYSLSGIKLSAGVQYKIIPLVALLVEAVHAPQTLTLEKVNGADPASKTKFDFDSSSLLIGVQVGL